MNVLLLTIALAAPAQTLSLEYAPGWTPDSVWIVRGEGYKEKWVTISVYHSSGALLDFGPWHPLPTKALAKPFPGFVRGETYFVFVRRGYNDDPLDGQLLSSGEFALPP